MPGIPGAQGLPGSRGIYFLCITLFI
jgi:hypothetical protein